MTAKKDKAKEILGKVYILGSIINNLEHIANDNFLYMLMRLTIEAVSIDTVVTLMKEFRFDINELKDVEDTKEFKEFAKAKMNIIERANVIITEMNNFEPELLSDSIRLLTTMIQGLREVKNGLPATTNLN